MPEGGAGGAGQGGGGAVRPHVLQHGGALPPAGKRTEISFI